MFSKDRTAAENRDPLIRRRGYETARTRLGTMTETKHISDHARHSDKNNVLLWFICSNLLDLELD